MKVAIFETEHHEVAYPVTYAFDNGKNEITLFIYPEIISPLEQLLGENKKRYKWVVKKKAQSKLSFIYKIYKEVKKEKIQLLYLDTITDKFISYALLIYLLKKTRTIVTVHTINNFFEHSYSFNIRRLVRILGKKLLTRVTKEYNVIHAPSAPYLRSKLPANKKVHCLPGSVFIRKENAYDIPEITERIKIVIPGSVDRRRRNYSEAFELSQQLQSAKIPHSITFLGRLIGDYGNDIRKKCDELNAAGYDFTFFGNSDVEQSKFDSIIQKSSIIFTPMQTNTIFADDIAETYGTSTATGSFSDVIRHAKPFIAPQSLTIDSVFEQSCFRYTSVNEILPFVSRIYYQPSFYKELLKNAVMASEHFTIERIRNRNPDLFQ